MASQWRPSMEDLVADLNDNESALAFFNIRYVLSEEDKSVIETVRNIAVQKGNSDFVDPSFALFDDGSYALTTRLYMNLNRDESSLANVRPFLEYGFSETGTEDLLLADFWPIPPWERVVMNTRAQTASGIPLSSIEESCGPTGGEISIAGSSTVFPVAQICTCSKALSFFFSSVRQLTLAPLSLGNDTGSEVYKVGCNVTFTVEGGGSSNGAGRVCGDLERGSPVDIGDMSRDWKTTEAAESLGFLYDCLVGDTKRSAIQIPVALDGLTVATQHGSAAQECIEILGGLTLDQLRWLYSDYNDEQLEASGWDPSSLKNSDGDSSTHLWSELDERCQRLEVRTAGPDEDSGTNEYFQEVVLSNHDQGETLAENRVLGYFNSAKDEDLISFLRDYSEAISFFGYSYYYQYSESLYAVPIKNSKDVYVTPNDETIADGSYHPLARRIYMNLLNDERKLQDTVPFITFGLSTKELMPVTGYVALSAQATEQMIERLEGAPYGSAQSLEDDKFSTGALIGTVVGICVSAVVVTGLAFFLFKRNKAKMGHP